MYVCWISSCDIGMVKRKVLTMGISLKANPEGKASGVQESQKIPLEGGMNHDFSSFSRLNSSDFV